MIADALQVDQMKLLYVNGKRVVLAHTGDGYVAFDDRCTRTRAARALVPVTRTSTRPLLVLALVLVRSRESVLVRSCESVLVRSREFVLVRSREFVLVCSRDLVLVRVLVLGLYSYSYSYS